MNDQAVRWLGEEIRAAIAVSEDENTSLADSIFAVAKALNSLGSNGADYMGGLERLSFEIKEGTERMAEAINELANALQESRGDA